MATAILLPAPELQFCDADGKPYAGGSIATYVPGTTTPKATWVDPGETALQTNPVILDAAGRCILYGSGDYRLILRDAAGNLIYDQLSSTVVSDAMQPVVSAPTIADAQALLGITGFATSADLATAVSAEQTARIAADTAETSARTAADTAETSARTTEDTNLQNQIDALSSGTGFSFEAGEDVTDGSGHVHVTFGTPFTSGVVKVVATAANTALDVVICTVSTTLTGFDCWTAGTGSGGTPVAAVRSFFWIAMGTR